MESVDNQHCDVSARFGDRNTAGGGSCGGGGGGGVRGEKQLGDGTGAWAVVNYGACGQPTVWMMYQQGLVTRTVLGGGGGGGRAGGWHRGLCCCKLWSLWTTSCMDDVSARFGGRNSAGGMAQGLVLL